MAAKFFLENLFEFIYDGIVSRGRNFLFNRLDRDDWVKVKTDSKARSFAENANLEEKILMLSKLGFGCSIIFWDKEKQKSKKIEDILIAYIDTDEKDITRQIIKDKIFACKDIDILKAIQTISQASMSKVYSINRKYAQVKENAGALKSRTLMNKLEADEAFQWYSKTLQTALDIEPLLEQFKINIIQLRILLYLHTAPNGATKDGLQRKLDRLNVTGLINDMYNANMIDYSLTNKNVVMIDSYGLMILEQLFSKFP